MVIEHEGNAAAGKLPSTEHFSARRLPRNPLHFVTAWRELRFAKKAVKRALLLHQRLRAERPALTGRALYLAFVCERSALGASAAQGVLQRAEASFAAWPNERDLIFRDVVQYLVISEYLASNPQRGSTTINMARTIEQLVPGEL